MEPNRGDTSEPDRSNGSDRTNSIGGSGARRRTFLRAAGAAAATVGGLAVGAPAAASGPYRNVVNLVEDLGADDTGEEPVNDEIDEAIEDDTKIVFPEGTYLISEEGVWRWRDSPSNVALVGRGGATLKPADGMGSGGPNEFMIVLWGDGIRIENFRVDQTAPNTASGFAVQSADDMVIRDIRFDGVADVDNGPFKILPGVTDPDGTGVIEEFHSPDGSTSYTRNGGAWVYPQHAGSLVFRRCSFEGCSDNAIYGSAPGNPPSATFPGQGGSVGVENCFFRNNNVSAIRLGSPGSYAKNCTVVFDGEEIPRQGSWGGLTGRAAWLWYDFEGSLKNVDVVSDHPRGLGFYTHESQSAAVDVYNCRFELNEDGTDALRSLSDGDRITLSNASVTGEAGEGAAIRIANRRIDARNLCLSQSGDDRDGIRLTDAEASINNALIDVTGEPIVADEDTELTVTNLRESGGCPRARRTHPTEQ